MNDESEPFSQDLFNRLAQSAMAETKDNLINLQQQINDLKNAFQLQINHQAFQIIELQKRNQGLWEIVTRLRQP